MPTAYAYPDAYLAKFCDQELELRAISDVALLGSSAGVTFSADWIRRLTIVQAYITVCLEHQASTEDLFSAKLKSYRAQLETLTTQAVSAAHVAADEVVSGGFFTIPLERN